ncbi:MAG: biotin/lipoyl-binding protein, partial [Alcaligenaceae bacterium]|nr:biotin/lipoyl-binding protein [Alcaligenaceae bacterium]
MSNLVEVKVPDIGDFSEVEVIEVMVAVGDMVNEEQSLITVESDKASMEIPSTASGRVKSVKIKVGDKVKEGSLILELEAEAATTTAPAAAASATSAVAPASAVAVPAPAVVAAAPAAVSERVMVEVPDIGDFAEVEVIEVLVAEGDTVAAEQSLITV